MIYLMTGSPLFARDLACGRSVSLLLLTERAGNSMFIVCSVLLRVITDAVYEWHYKFVPYAYWGCVCGSHQCEHYSPHGSVYR